MAEISDYLENWIIDNLPTLDGTVCLALFTAVTGLESGTPTAEISGNAYARQNADLAAASGGASSNSGSVIFPAADPAGWGTVTHAALVNSATAVNWGTA